MSGSDLVVWSDELVTGVEIIDAQHRMLVNLINDANTIMSADSSAKTLKRLVRDLLAYALFHFDAEEKLMLEYKYAESNPEDMETQLREHREFSARVISVRDGVEKGNLISREELLTYLNSWLVGHILNTDKRLGAFILSKIKSAPNRVC